MARKWKQINKFIEVLDHALDGTPLKRSSQVDVIDFGSGKGYLTFAVHAHLAARLGVAPTVVGHELRADLVDFCNRVAVETGYGGGEVNPRLVADRPVGLEREDEGAVRHGQGDERCSAQKAREVEQGPE